MASVEEMTLVHCGHSFEKDVSLKLVRAMRYYWMDLQFFFMWGLYAIWFDVSESS